MPIDFSIHKGWIPAPAEPDEEFLARVEKSHQRLLNPRAIKDVDFDQSVLPLLIFRSNKKLPFWTGALTWIVSFEDGCKIPLIQLPIKPRRYTFTKEREIIDHERVHALRVAFEEPMFEEIIAYRTSPSKFRRFFGPLLGTSTEGTLFFLSFPVFFFLRVPWVFPLFTCLLLMRLCWRQFLFSRALKSIQKRFKRSEEVIVFLSDREIRQAAKGDITFFDGTSIRMQQVEAIFGIDT